MADRTHSTGRLRAHITGAAPRLGSPSLRTSASRADGLHPGRPPALVAILLRAARSCGTPRPKTIPSSTPSVGVALLSTQRGAAPAPPGSCFLRCSLHGDPDSSGTQTQCGGAGVDPRRAGAPRHRSPGGAAAAGRWPRHEVVPDGAGSPENDGPARSRASRIPRREKSAAAGAGGWGKRGGGLLLYGRSRLGCDRPAARDGGTSG